MACSPAQTQQDETISAGAQPIDINLTSDDAETETPTLPERILIELHIIHTDEIIETLSVPSIYIDPRIPGYVESVMDGHLSTYRFYLVALLKDGMLLDADAAEGEHVQLISRLTIFVAREQLELMQFIYSTDRPESGRYTATDEYRFGARYYRPPGNYEYAKREYVGDHPDVGFVRIVCSPDLRPGGVRSFETGLCSAMFEVHDVLWMKVPFPPSEFDKWQDIVSAANDLVSSFRSE